MIRTLENQLKERDKIIESQSSDIKQLAAQIDQLREQSNEAEKLKERFEAAFKIKDDEIAFLRGHVAQLTQSIGQLSLKPGDEEIEKKGWWQFWK